MSGRGLIWTPTMIAELTQMHERVPEISFREMAQRMQALGHPVTRNAMIGKARRLGLPPRDAPAHIVASTKRIVEYNRNRVRVDPVPLIKGKAPPIAPVATNQRSGLLIDLEHDQCRWPVAPGPSGHSIYLFCTADVVYGKRWCVEHCKLAFQPVGRGR